MSKIIFRGRHERLQLDELQNSYENGGLRLPNIAVKADALLLKQIFRLLNLKMTWMDYTFTSLMFNGFLDEHREPIAEVSEAEDLKTREIYFERSSFLNI